MCVAERCLTISPAGAVSVQHLVMAHIDLAAALRRMRSELVGDTITTVDLDCTLCAECCWARAAAWGRGTRS